MAIREDLVARGARFLSSSKVSTTPFADKVKFLKEKGLTDEEVSAADSRAHMVAAAPRAPGGPPAADARGLVGALTANAPALGRAAAAAAAAAKDPVRIDCADAARPAGPYSQAVAAGPLVFCSGFIGVGGDGKLVAGGAAPEATAAMEHLKKVLAAAGSDLSKVVKTTVLLADLGDYDAVNRAYAEALGGSANGCLPARCCYQVAALPAGARVEIDAIAIAIPAASPAPTPARARAPPTLKSKL